MKNTFQVLAGFLDRLEGEVEGREFPEPTPEIQAKLGKFARGELRGTDQTAVLNMLKHNPHLIARLADEVKALRSESKN